MKTTDSIRTAAFGIGACIVLAAHGGSSQETVVSGSATNIVVGTGLASMNAASTKGVTGSNRQSVQIGSAVNAAVGGTAEMHLGSVDGVAGDNVQRVVVGGGVTNAAAAGGHAVVGIASRKSAAQGNRQTAIVGGSVVNIAGPGATSKVELDYR